MPLSLQDAMIGAYLKNKVDQNDDELNGDGDDNFALGQQSTRNYEIFNTFGSRIYLASVRQFESSNICTRACNLETKYEVFIWNHLGHPAFRMEGDNGRCGHGAGVSVSLPDQYVLGRIAQEPNTCYLEYSLLDNGHPGTTLLRIRGPRRECGCCGGLSIADDLALYTDDGKFIGRITHRWSELGENFIKDDDTSFSSYGLAFPIEMSPNLKAVTLCCLILLDIQFCPSTKDWHHIKSNKGHSCYIVFMLSLILSVTIFMAFYLVTRPEHNLLP